MVINATLTIQDKTTLHHGGQDYVFTLAFPTQTITVRELIRARVQSEVEEYNAHQPDFFRGLVQPEDAEITLNGYKLSGRRPIDGEKQCEKATRAFQQNGFILLIDDRQADRLDQTIEIGPQTTVTFLKLVPLVGG